MQTPSFQTAPPASSRHPVPPLSADEGARFASSQQMRWLIAGLVGTALLFGAEIGHYVVSTDLGATDRMEVNANHDPQCKPLHSSYDFTCPFPGYNSVQMTCMTTGCGDRNLNMPPITEASRSKTEATERQDKIASLAVEKPFSGNDPEWKLAAQVLTTGKVTDPPPVQIHGAPQTLEEAQLAVRQRSLELTRRDAQEWLAQHER